MNTTEKLNRIREIETQRAKTDEEIIALESQVDALQLRIRELDQEQRAIIEGKPVKVKSVAPEASPEKKPRKPRTPKAPSDDGKVSANVGSIDDVKASILGLLRGNPGQQFGAGRIAHLLFTDTKLVSKALIGLDVKTEGNKRGKVYFVEAEQATEEGDDGDAVETLGVALDE